MWRLWRRLGGRKDRRTSLACSGPHHRWIRRYCEYRQPDHDAFSYLVLDNWPPAATAFCDTGRSEASREAGQRIRVVLGCQPASGLHHKGVVPIPCARTFYPNYRVTVKRSNDEAEQLLVSIDGSTMTMLRTFTVESSTLSGDDWIVTLVPG